MAGKHIAKSNGSSKKPLIITICVIAVVIIVAVAFVLFFTNKNSSTEVADTTSNTASTAVTKETQIQQSSTEQTEQSENSEEENASESTVQEASHQDSNVSLPQESIDIVVPASGGEQKNSFNATFVPYKAVDSTSGDNVALREFFGSSYTEGVLTFNNDGTFIDTLVATDNNSGAYVVEDSTITATYTNDKNLSITVNSWNGDTPSELIVHYNGCDVYFNS